MNTPVIPISVLDRNGQREGCLFALVRIGTRKYIEINYYVTLYRCFFALT